MVDRSKSRRRWASPSSTSSMADEMTPRTEAEGKSLDRVQRVLASVLIIFVMGLISAVLALYLVLGGKDGLAHSDVVGLWVMTGVIGLLSAGMVLMINRRRPYHPLVLLGLIPMVASWYWIFH
jgi:CHASE2 domain-containing sensor protein